MKFFFAPDTTETIGSNSHSDGKKMLRHVGSPSSVKHFKEGGYDEIWSCIIVHGNIAE